MLLGKIIGTATSSVKHASLHGWKLLLVQPLLADRATADGEPVLAIDTLGAGRGMNVIITSDGKFTSELVGTKATPIRWSVIGIAEPNDAESS